MMAQPGKCPVVLDVDEQAVLDMDVDDQAMDEPEDSLVAWWTAGTQDQMVAWQPQAMEQVVVLQATELKLQACSRRGLNGITRAVSGREVEMAGLS